jgi:hypothetical protein
MSDHLVELPAPVMSESAFQRRREHLLAELERPASHRRHVVAAALVAVVLALLAFAPISGASLGHRLVSGLGALWSSPAQPTKYPADVQDMAHSATIEPPGVTYKGGKPLTGKARDLLTGLGTAGDTITAYPTSSGAVCYMIEGAGSCANLAKWPWNTVGFTFSIFSTRDGGTRVFGIAADKVTSVSVEVAGVEQLAVLQNNALYYQLPPSVHDSDIQQVTATWSDGSTHSVPLRIHWDPPHG